MERPSEEEVLLLPLLRLLLLCLRWLLSVPWYGQLAPAVLAVLPRLGPQLRWRWLRPSQWLLWSWPQVREPPLRRSLTLQLLPLWPLLLLLFLVLPLLVLLFLLPGPLLPLVLPPLVVQSLLVLLLLLIQALLVLRLLLAQSLLVLRLLLAQSLLVLRPLLELRRLSSC